MRELENQTCLQEILVQTINIKDGHHEAFRKRLGTAISRELSLRSDPNNRKFYLKSILMPGFDDQKFRGVETIDFIRGDDTILGASFTISPPSDGINKELSEYYDVLYGDIFDIIKQHYYESPDKASELLTGLSTNTFNVSILHSSEDEADLSFSYTTSQYESNQIVGEATEQTRLILEKIGADIIKGIIPVIPLERLLYLNNGHYDHIHSGSCPAVINLEPYDDVDNPARLTLKTGRTIMLPSYLSDLSPFDSETLKEILWYLENLVEHRPTFNPLLNLVTLELGRRQNLAN
jgi:hypothetical protein